MCLLLCILLEKLNWNMLLLDFSHTLSNKFSTVADLSVVVKDLITQMCPISPIIQVYLADSTVSSSSQSLVPSHLCHSFSNSKLNIKVLKFEKAKS